MKKAGRSGTHTHTVPVSCLSSPQMLAFLYPSLQNAVPLVLDSPSEQDAQGCGGVTIPGGVEELHRCGIEIRVLVGIVGVGSWLN